MKTVCYLLANFLKLTELNLIKLGCCDSCSLHSKHIELRPEKGARGEGGASVSGQLCLHISERLLSLMCAHLMGF